MSWNETKKWQNIKASTSKILRRIPRQERCLYEVDFKTGEFSARDIPVSATILVFTTKNKSKIKANFDEN